MSGATRISVIIPTYDRRDVLARTLRHLCAQDYPEDAYEVLVVDNSADGTPSMVEAFAAGARCRVRLVRTPERLPAVKRNQGVRLATGDLALFLNDDLWVDPDFLSRHAAAHAAHDAPVAVVGKVDQSPEMPRTPFGEWYTPFAYHEIAHRGGREVPYRYFWSMNLSLPRGEMLDRDLVFHEDWTEIGHEDVELGYRWSRAGRKIVYEPRARGDHYHPHTLASACRLQRSIGRGLRELERLVPDPDLLERYGVFSWRNRPRAIARGLARRALFNAATVPPAARWLEGRRRNSTLSRWMYWKVLLHYTNLGYREGTPRATRPLATRPPLAEGRA